MARFIRLPCRMACSAAFLFIYPSGCGDTNPPAVAGNSPGHSLSAKVESTAAGFPDDAATHALYEQMLAALRSAESLTFTSHYQSEAAGTFEKACTYRVWLKKPNYFRMETQATLGEVSGVLIGDGNALWIYWPGGRPRWQSVPESEADEKTRFTSYMTKPAPQAKHSIWHEAIFLGGGMVFPIVDASTFHGHVDTLAPYVDGVRRLGAETIAGEECDQIEVSLAGGQRRWFLSLAQRDHLPRRLKEIVRVSTDHVTQEGWSSVIINGEIPDSLFAWTPPAGWTRFQLRPAEDHLLKPGTPAPDFNLASVSGERIKLADFRGKVVLLSFWRVGCPPCRVEMPLLQDLHAKYASHGLAIIAVNTADDPQIVSDYLRDLGITYPNILDTSLAGEKTFQDYGGSTLPMNYLLDTTGLVADAWVGIRDDAALLSSVQSIPGPLRDFLFQQQP